MSRKCAVCGGDTQILKNEHNRVVDFRLCSGECREKWFKWMKACKAHANPPSTLYPRIIGDNHINEHLEHVENKILGVQPSMIVFDEYLDTDMLDSGDIIEPLTDVEKECLKKIMNRLYGKRNDA